MTLRSTRERIIQTVTFEVVGIALVSPLYATVSGKTAIASIALITLLSIVIVTWSPVFNTLFDLLERHFSGRLACQRPHGLRMFHASMHEISAILLTCPLLIWVGGYSLGAALSVNVGLTLTYTIYTYLFHVAYDRLRPVRLRNEAGTETASPHRI
ncbi:PACE efflux transporter [Roseibium sp. SCP14]|uniref:PACE efflux transporter n=1 Tax=Roseibium sp. SCP14 TaxID=3141375 RepID=UPI00333A209D